MRPPNRIEPFLTIVEGSVSIVLKTYYKFHILMNKWRILSKVCTQVLKKLGRNIQICDLRKFW